MNRIHTQTRRPPHPANRMIRFWHPKKIDRLFVILFSLLLIGSAQADSQRMSQHLSVFGAVQAEQQFTLGQLKQLAGSHLKDIPVLCQSGANKGHMESLSGVPLKTLLEHVGLKVPKGKDLRKVAILAYGTDDYWVTFSWGEIFNQPQGDRVLIYYAKNGQALGQESGQFALMPTNDTRTGARQVKWLERIEVRLMTP
ncbi:MAG: molybdopterin-dependent oxidoreductase [Hydrogenovibrio sp.]